MPFSPFHPDAVRAGERLLAGPAEVVASVTRGVRWSLNPKP